MPFVSSSSKEPMSKASAAFTSPRGGISGGGYCGGRGLASARARPAGHPRPGPPVPSAGRPSASPASGRRGSPSPPGPCGETPVTGLRPGQVATASSGLSRLPVQRPWPSSLNLNHFLISSGESRVPTSRRVVVRFNIINLATSCLALSKCLINIKSRCYHHHLISPSSLPGPSGSRSPASSGSCVPEDAGLDWLCPGSCELRGAGSSEGHSPVRRGHRQRPSSHCGGLDTAASRVLRALLRALTLGPGSPVSGGRPSAAAPPARSGARGRRSRAAPRPGGESPLSAAATEEPGAQESEKQAPLPYCPTPAGMSALTIQGRRPVWG